MEQYFKGFMASKIMDFRGYWTNIFTVIEKRRKKKKDTPTKTKNPNCQPGIL